MSNLLECMSNYLEYQKRQVSLQFTEARDDARDASLLDLACPCTKESYENHSQAYNKFDGI